MACPRWRRSSSRGLCQVICLNATWFGDEARAGESLEHDKCPCRCTVLDRRTVISRQVVTVSRPVSGIL